MPTIEERDSEADVREELERKEKEYWRNIERLEYMLEDIRRRGEYQASQMEALNSTVIDYEPGDLLEMREKELH